MSEISKKAAELKRKAGDEAQEFAKDVKDLAAQLKRKAGDEAQELATDVKDLAADAKDALASATETVKAKLEAAGDRIKNG